MSRLAENQVPDRESRRVHMEQKLKNRKENAPGVFRRAQIGGFHRDHRQPDGGR